MSKFGPRRQRLLRIKKRRKKIPGRERVPSSLRPSLEPLRLGRPGKPWARAGRVRGETPALSRLRSFGSLLHPAIRGIAGCRVLKWGEGGDPVTEALLLSFSLSSLSKPSGLYPPEGNALRSVPVAQFPGQKSGGCCGPGPGLEQPGDPRKIFQRRIDFTERRSRLSLLEAQRRADSSAARSWQGAAAEGGAGGRSGLDRLGPGNQR